MDLVNTIEKAMSALSRTYNALKSSYEMRILGVRLQTYALFKVLSQGFDFIFCNKITQHIDEHWFMQTWAMLMFIYMLGLL